MSRATADRPFEYVLVPSLALARVRPDPGPFGGRFTPGQPVSTFPNRGGDAVLVVPSPEACPRQAGAHLARFVCDAPEVLIHSLWIELGRAVQEWWIAREDALWTSTSGLGVHWLHLRLDSRPKYYQHAPYRRPPGP